MKLELDDSRRLTGKGLLWDLPGAIMDVFVDGIDKQAVVACWQKHVTALLDGVGWTTSKTMVRIFEDGVSLALSAPFDALYAATDINEAAWQLTCDELNGKTIDAASLLPRLTQLIADEVNPALLALIEAAQARNVPWLTDDDEFSLGFGPSVAIWPVDKLPDIDKLDWAKYQTVPVAMITGTNGKSTSVRLASEMIKQAGKCCGVTSTDFIRVGDTIIDKGDYSGPGGARTLLRNRQVEVALLEVARGGILRRGLPIPQVDVALITNVAEDHLGQYGINTLQGLTATKFVVAKALSDNGMLVLNADDIGVVNYAKHIDKRQCWFSCDPFNPVLLAHVKAGGAVCYVRDGMMVYQDAMGCDDIIAVEAVPMTFNGAAVHNIQNALGAIGVAKHLQVSNGDIAKALACFRSDAADNPGRGNVFKLKGATIIIDFAHNEHSMSAIVATTNNMPAKQKWLMLSAAGDRSDDDIWVMTEAAMVMAPHHMVVAELAVYLRGRKLGDIPQLIQSAATIKGLDAAEFHVEPTPLDGVKRVVESLQPGDLALLLVLSDREAIVEWLDNQH